MHYDDSVEEARMGSLQIRELPQDVYEALSARARRDRRSLAQQAVVELRRASGHDARIQAVEALRRELAGGAPRRLSRAPEALVREDRGR
jgi:plasmid stability protein